MKNIDIILTITYLLTILFFIKSQILNKSLILWQREVESELEVTESTEEGIAWGECVTQVGH